MGWKITYVSSRQQPASEGRVRDDSDAELFRGFEQTNFGILDVEHKGGVFDLQSRDRVDCVGTA